MWGGGNSWRRLIGLLWVAALASCTCGEPPVEMRLAAMQPATGLAGQAIPVQISGQGFQPLVHVDYNAPRRSRVDVAFAALLGGQALEQVAYVDGQHLSAQIPATLPVGVYALTVRAPDGTTAQLADAFTITATVADGGSVDAGVPADWFDTAWRCRAPLQIDATALGSGDLTDFPALVAVDGSWFDYGRAAADGADVRFVSATGQLLPYEIEQWTPGATSVVWVGVPQIAGGTASGYLHVYFDRPGAVSAAAPARVFANGFAAVFHLNSDLRDSTANANDGTNRGSTSAAGYLAGGRGFEFELAPEIAIGDTNLPLDTSARTICAWAAPSAMDTVIKHWFISYGAFTTYGGFFIGRVGADLWCGGVGDDIIATGIFALDRWGYHCCVVETGNNVSLYSDGALVIGPQRHRNWSVAAGESLIGGHINPSVAEYWDGRIDEVRISSVARSAAWLRAEYLSMTGALLRPGAVSCLD